MLQESSPSLGAHSLLSALILAARRAWAQPSALQAKDVLSLRPDVKEPMPNSPVQSLQVPKARARLDSVVPETQEVELVPLVTPQGSQLNSWEVLQLLSLYLRTCAQSKAHNSLRPNRRKQGSPNLPHLPVVSRDRKLWQAN